MEIQFDQEVKLVWNPALKRGLSPPKQVHCAWISRRDQSLVPSLGDPRTHGRLFRDSCLSFPLWGGGGDLASDTLGELGGLGT